MITIEDLFRIQSQFNSKIYGDTQSNLEKTEITKTLALCLHSEVSELIQSLTYKDHHYKSSDVDKIKMLFESVDVFRYVLAILNLNGIEPKDFITAYFDKDYYLRAINKTPEQWDGVKPVVIVDIDDVLSEFRQNFADWLEEHYDLNIDVDSDEYYFITALNTLDVNPEDVFEEFVNQGGFRNLDFVPNAWNMLNDLKKQGYWIQLLTARPKENLKCFYDTYFWLHVNEVPYDAVDFSSEKFRWCAKSRYYDEGKIEFAIDDSPKHIAEYAKHGLKCWYPIKNYNKEISNMDNVYGYKDPKLFKLK